ncbi:MAG TPA: hypothetical protein ENI86_04260 [Acidimicrobiales bacterium]|nr:hypothetical protein [Acidimicrobiales bacterium]
MAVIVALGLAAAACGDSTGTDAGENTAGTGSTSVVTTADTFDMAALPPGTLESWRNNTGLEIKPDDVWAKRIATACSEGVWEPDVAERLAKEYAAEDGATSEQLADTSYLESAAAGLWQVAVAACHDSFPPDTLERGPNFHFNS